MKNEKFSISQMQSNTPLLLLLLLLASFPLQPASFLLPSTQINIHNTWPAACYKHPLTGKRFRIALCNMYIHFIAKKEAEEETTTGEDTGQLRLKCKSQTRLSRLLITSFWKWGSPHGEVVQQIQSFLYVLGSFCEEKMLKKKTYLAVLKGANGSCRAVSEFDMKNRDVAAAAQFTAGQPVTLVLLQRRHLAAIPRLPGSFRTTQIPRK